MPDSIFDRVRDFFPATYDALANASYFGEEGIQTAVNTAKFRLFATVVSPALEATVYNPFVLDYAAKVVALRVIPAGADFWSDQLTSETAREESINYPDRIDSLWRIHARLLTEIREEEPLFQYHFPAPTRRRKSASPVVSTTGPLVTSNPSDLGAARTGARFGATTYPFLPWSDWV